MKKLINKIAVGKNLSAVFRNIDGLVLLAVGSLLLLMVLPYFIWGEDCVITVHDNFRRCNHCPLFSDF